MRILQAAGVAGPADGGMSTFLDAVGRGYRAAGHEVVSVVPGPADGDDVAGAGRRVTLRSPALPCSGRSHRVLTGIDRLRAIVEAARPDVLEVSDCLVLRGLGRWARQRGLPAVVVAHQRADVPLPACQPGAIVAQRVADRISGSYDRGLAERFDTVACLSDWSAAQLERAGVRTYARVPPGVDLDAFSADRRGASLRRSLTPYGEVLLVCVSPLTRRGRVDVALGAVRVLQRRGIDARLVVAGVGPHETRLRTAARGLPVTFLGELRGRVPVADLLASADVAICPGPAAHVGYAALQAMASGTPVVTARTGAMPELVVRGAGVATWSHPRAVAAAVRGLLEAMPDERRDAARRRAEEFPWASTVARLLDVHGRSVPRA